MQVPLPWERLLWSTRAAWPPGTRYALTDFRLVHQNGRRSAEIALHEIGEVRCTRSWLDHLFATSTVTVHTRTGSRPAFVVRHLRCGAALAALLELAAGDPPRTLDPDGVRAALAWDPAHPHRAGRALGVAAVAVVACVALLAGLPRTSGTLAHSTDERGIARVEARSREATVAFMQTTVMEWARVALAPIVGGRDKVRCETCHGTDPDEREWRMPAVVALPEPHFQTLGWELYSGAMDAQMRNAIYGYLAESEKQAKATYMREIVMPGMARLLGRPAYDFTRTYDYNRSQQAFGCYHCHRVK